MNGMPLSGVVVGPDGTAYQTTVDQASKTTVVTTISPSGTVTTSSTAGSPVGRTVVVAPDGIAYQVVVTIPGPNMPDAAQSSVTVMQLNASQATTITFTDALPVGQVVIGSDGRAYLVTSQISYDPTDPASAAIQTVVTSLGIDGPAAVSTVDGMALSNLAVTADRQGWLVTRTGQPDTYDDRAWLLTLGAAGTVTPPPADTRPPLIRQLDRFVRAVTSVPAAIARAAAENLVRTMAAAAEATAKAVANAARAAESLADAFFDTLNRTIEWAARSAESFADVDKEIAKLLGLSGPAAKLVTRFVPYVGMAVSASDIGTGLGNLMTGKPVSGALGFASGLVGLAGGAFLVLPLGQPIGLGLLGISAGLSGAGLLLDTFVPDLDANVNRFVQDVERTTAKAATDFVDGVARTADAVAQGARDFADDAVEFIRNPKPPWEWKL
jgi:hypothetical protein